MELYLFYALMVVYGAFYGAVTTAKKGEEYSSLSMKYPLLGVFAFFGLMTVIYYLLTMADTKPAGVCHTYFGAILLVAIFFLAQHITGKIRK